MKINDLLKDEIIHGIFAIPSAFLLYSIWPSFSAVGLFYIVTYFIDADHLFDYSQYYGFSFNFKKFLSGTYFDLSKKAYVFFHAWEWVVILLYFASAAGWQSWFTAVSLGIFTHLVYDTLSYKSGVLHFSIIYRCSKGFRLG
jgi:hypothetical protein